MPLNAANFTANGHLIHQDLQQFVDLLTGVMTDQPVNLGNTLNVTGVATHGSDVIVAGAVKFGTTGASTTTIYSPSAGSITVTAITTLGGGLFFSTDNAFDIGATGTGRPRNLFVAGSLTAPIFTATASMTSPVYNVGSGVTRLTTMGSTSVRLESTTQYAMLSALSGTHMSGNAYWDGTNWQRYSTSAGSGIWVVGQGSLLFQTAAAGTGVPTLTVVLTVDTVGNLRSITGGIATGPSMSSGWPIAGDFNASRGSNPATGYVFLGDQNHYVGFDGTNYRMLTSNLSLEGGLIANYFSVTGHSVIAVATGDVSSTAGSEGQLELQNTGGGAGASKIAFHRVGIYAAYLGLASDNVFRAGGWSMGSGAWRLILGDDWANGGALHVAGRFLSDQYIIAGTSLSTNSGVVYFRSDNGVSITWDGTSLNTNVAIGAMGGVVYFESGRNVYLQWRSDLNMLWSRWSGGFRVEGPVYVAGRLISNAWDNGASQCFGGGTYCAAAAYSLYAMQVWATNSANQNAFVAPNIGDNRGQGLAWQWATWACVDHAREYGLQVAPIADPLRILRALEPYYYEHMSFGSYEPNSPPGRPRPMRRPDGSLVTTPLYGFSAKEVAEYLPELVEYNPETGEPEALDLGRMVAVLWAAVKQLERTRV